MNLRAAAALAHDDRQGAVEELRRQLCTMATAAGATPRWATLTVTGPTEMTGVDEAARFEWTADVDAECESAPDGDGRHPAPDRPMSAQRAAADSGRCARSRRPHR